MMNIDILISEADRMMEAAKAEINRSREDVTAHLVCMNSRQSILNYLLSFLHKNGVELRKPVTMASLLEQCSGVDARFELIDLTPINCRNKVDHSDYCLDVDVVGECLQIAKQTRAIALDESPSH